MWSFSTKNQYFKQKQKKTTIACRKYKVNAFKGNILQYHYISIFQNNESKRCKKRV